MGWAEFLGLRIAVDAGVFVPRRRTELLAREAIASSAAGAVVVDLCCGSGAIGAAVAASVPGAWVFAADLDSLAVAVARSNLPPDHVFEGDLFEPLPDALLDRVDVLAVNAPYVPSAEIAMMPPEARDHEPRVTLDGGADGLDVHRRVAAGAGMWLRRGGVLIIEVADRQIATAERILRSHGLESRVVVDDELGATVIVGTRR